MKLHEALRKLCLEHGNIIVQKKNLVYLLSDMGAFEELPGMREVIKAMVSGGFARDLCARSLRNDREAFLQHAEEVKKALAAKGNFPLEDARFAVDAVSFAFGFMDSVKEPDERKTDYRKLYAESGGAAPGNGKEHKVPVVRSKSGRYIEQLRVKAEKGDAEAQYKLGAQHLFGEGVTQSYDKAMEWFRKAAEQGNAEADRNLGGMYLSGLGVQKDPAEGMKWIRKAAEDEEKTEDESGSSD